MTNRSRKNKQRNAIDTQPQLYGVIGHPVAHSLSPAMHTLALTTAGINGVYLAFDVTDLASAIAGIRALPIQGVSVTVPHKTTIMPYLDAIDDIALAIGAVNTITNDNGRLTGHNTDAYGAITALEQHCGSIRGKTIAILGAGGAARAVGYGAIQKGARIHIINRTRSKGEKLAADLGADYLDPSQLPEIPCDILINSTSAGMHPHTDEMPIPPDALPSGITVMDIIYNPLETRLLKEASTRGCKTIDGVSMFVHQGARQFFLWTGREPPVDQMTALVYATLKNT